MGKLITAQPTLDTDAYTAGDCLGGLLTFATPWTAGKRTLLLKDAFILDDAATPDEADVTLFLFADSDLAGTDDAAFAISQNQFTGGDLLIPDGINFTSYSDTPIGTNAGAKLAIKTGLDRLIQTDGKGNVYGQLVANGTPTFAADQLIIALILGEYS